MASEQIVEAFLRWNIITLCISLLVVAILSVKMVRFMKNYIIFHNLPGSADRSYIFGHLHQFHSGGEAHLAIGRKRMQQCNGRYACMWMNPFKPDIVVYHPELVKKVFAASATKTHSYSFAHAWIGDGLIAANGQRWARSRRLLTPAFHFNVLKDYIRVYNEEKLDKAAETGENIDIFPKITLCTLEIILQCSLGYEADIQEKGHPYAEAARELNEAWVKRSRSPWLFPEFIFRLTSLGKTFFKNCDYVHKFAEQIIERRKEDLEKGKATKGRHMDFIDILLSARDEDGKPMTTEEIRNEVDTFVFAGHDTTATAIPWALYTLAKHKEYQDRVQEEVDSIVKGRDRPDILWQDLSKLEMLALCMKETMRLYTPVPFSKRLLDVDVDLDGQIIPAGTDVVIPTIHIHRNEQVWDEPDEFRPERFNTDNRSSLDSHAFVPFSAGARNCIGQNFALNEEKVLVARILQRYTIRLPPDA